MLQYGSVYPLHMVGELRPSFSHSIQSATLMSLGVMMGIAYHTIGNVMVLMTVETAVMSTVSCCLEASGGNA